jgi:hypothetical protein
VGGLFICGIFVAFILFVVIAAANKPAQNLSFAPDQSIAFGGGVGYGRSDPMVDRLARAVPARGILLNVSMTGQRTKHRGQRFEIRQCRIDIEPSGYAPYEVTAAVYIPASLIRDVLPGSTMEVRVDSANLQYVLVIGPEVGFAQGAVRTA